MTLPRNLTVLLAPVLSHRDPEHWQRSEDFFPDHFLPDTVSSFIFGSEIKECIARTSGKRDRRALGFIQFPISNERWIDWVGCYWKINFLTFIFHFCKGLSGRSVSLLAIGIGQINVLCRRQRDTRTPTSRSVPGRAIASVSAAVHRWPFPRKNAWQGAVQEIIISRPEVCPSGREDGAVVVLQKILSRKRGAISRK